MKRVLGLLLLALVAYAVLVVAKLPAAVAYQAARAYLPPAVQLYDLAGTVFSGHGRALVMGRVPLSRVRWRFHPWSLLSGMLAYQLKLESPAGPVRGRIGATVTRVLVIEDLEGILNLADFLRLAGEDEPKGNGWVKPDIAEIRRQPDGRIAISGSVLFSDLVWLDGGRIELGRLVIEMDGEGPPWKATLKDDGGPIRVAGEAEVSQGGGYRLSAVLAVREGSPPEVEQILELVGRGDSEGRHSIDLEGRF